MNHGAFACKFDGDSRMKMCSYLRTAYTYLQIIDYDEPVTKYSRGCSSY